MGKPPVSAVYFYRTPEVDEFIQEFIRVRSWHLKENCSSASNDADGQPTRPYRRQQRKKKAQNIGRDDETLNDDMLDAAKEMARGTSIHLDAFISLVVTHNEFVEALNHKEYKAIQPKKFKLYEIMKNSSVSDRKVPKYTAGDDLQSALREAEEKRYQRLVADVQTKFQSTESKVAKFKPPIIGGANAIFGVVLTFIGGYSIAGVLGVKDNIKKAIIATALASGALLVDTALFLMRGEW
ncbi:endoplasmic reticulum-based factor for assembly of V-ATPase [Babesia ovis]|uniref:Endoplasmic reticulum-based factor for assembly of V-ATPase n=1 Tax=Babesia ovis TaxID=5869 RepID=A0A9W5TD06_BABOV|nr:endoplasmic reticulum-based factor for assembly of V-ATPase [Babesia ovis]